jgi:DNA-binding NarL/FixJ family response regulator
MTTVATPPKPLSQAPTARKSTPDACPDHRPRLVIADDDPLVRLLLSASLVDQFAVVGVAADGEETIEQVRLTKPDAALVDVHMPKGGGVLAARDILEIAPNTAIVMLSGYEPVWGVSQLLRAGAVIYRRKGVGPGALAEALTQAIRANTAERRESAWTILSWYCVTLERRSRPRVVPRRV